VQKGTFEDAPVDLLSAFHVAEAASVPDRSAASLCTSDRLAMAGKVPVETHMGTLAALYHFLENGRVRFVQVLRN
jgi:hypothetical protein